MNVIRLSSNNLNRGKTQVIVTVIPAEHTLPFTNKSKLKSLILLVRLVYTFIYTQEKCPGKS